MPGLPAARRRAFGSRPRSSGTTPKQRPPLGSVLEAAVSEPPPKKRKYIPGGPGGGGRYIEVDGSTTGAFGTAIGNRPGPPNPFASLQPRLLKSAPRLTQPHPSRHHASQSAPRPRASQPPRPKHVERELEALEGDPDTPTQERPRRERRRERNSITINTAASGAANAAPRPRYSSAAAATAAMAQNDGFKPREERGWEEFHQDLEIDADLPCFDAPEVDGLVKPSTPAALSNGTTAGGEGSAGLQNGEVAVIEQVVFTPPKKRGPGRPPRRPPGVILGYTPDTPKNVPPPGPNPREKLTLPKPTFRRVNPFEAYEKTTGGGPQHDYVDGAMASVGYQESEIFPQPPHFIRMSEETLEDDVEISASVKGDIDNDKGMTGNPKRVEYDMDEQDQKFLDEYNRHRRERDVEAIKPAIFEIIMSYIEKEWHALERRIPKPNPKPPQTHRPRSSSAAAVNGEAPGQGEEQDSKCAICDDGDCENTNAIVFCDGCDLAVHQECYGVPFIPEGQWLCRKCRVIGSGVPTCIFCPNMDGAFKQTNSSKWAHLLCAIWIPEVSLGNTTFMEPVMDVEKVPRQRWKLTCVICNQKMGACIQCGNKNCFRAFHVTCGRKAKWCLQMKSSHGGPANLDASVLKAYCDKHVPDEWAEANDVDAATADTIHYYRHAMRGKIWVTGHQAAQLHTYSHQHHIPIPSVEEPAPPTNPKINLIVKDDKGKKKKGAATAPPKTMWRLPSGAPVIPGVMCDSVEVLLRRFSVQKRKDFAADMCKYWTLKREARRGAPLIKRLQLQMEMFSSMEITRRDFAAMGAAGGPRLKRRKAFTQTLQRDSTQLKQISEMLVRRQEMVVEDDQVLESLIDTVHFPVVPLLHKALEKAISLNGKGYFRAALLDLQDKLDKRYYVTVHDFAVDLAAVFAGVISDPKPTTAAISSQEDGVLDEHALRTAFNAEQKDKRKVAKRILRSVENMLKEAARGEADLLRNTPHHPADFNLVEMGIPVTDPEPILTSAKAAEPVGESIQAADASAAVEGETIHVASNNGAMENADTAMDIDTVESTAEAKKQASPTSHPTPDASLLAEPIVHPPSNSPPAASQQQNGGPPTPPLSHASASSAVAATGSGKAAGASEAVTTNGVSAVDETTVDAIAATNGAVTTTGTKPGIAITNADAGDLAPPKIQEPSEPPHPLVVGGTPWYLKAFEPSGTTVSDEKWSGREAARALSEELSDMEDAELDGLVEQDADIVMGNAVNGGENAELENEDEDEQQEGKTRSRTRTKSTPKKATPKKQESSRATRSKAAMPLRGSDQNTPTPTQARTRNMRSRMNR